MVENLVILAASVFEISCGTKTNQQTNGQTDRHNAAEWTPYPRDYGRRG